MAFSNAAWASALRIFGKHTTEIIAGTTPTRTSVNLPLPTVGTLSFAFLDGNTADMRYTVNGVTQTKRIVRQQFALPSTSCR